jgi:aconitate hydratase
MACSVLSGNRNFEGRISPDVRANYLASPPLVVAYALAGTMDIDLTTDRSARRRTARTSTSRTSGRRQAEIAEFVARRHPRGVQSKKYADVFKGDEKWQAVKVTEAETYDWPDNLDLHPEPALFPKAWASRSRARSRTSRARMLAFGDMITTDHISAGRVDQGDSPAGPT